MTAPNWSENDLKILREYYPTMGRKVKAMLEYKDRTENSIVKKASQFKIKSQLNHKWCRKWTDEEYEILKAQYPKCGSKIPELNYKTVDQIKNAARRLDLLYTGENPWLGWEDKIIMERYYEEGTNIAKDLNHQNEHMIIKRAKKLGIRHKTYRPWSEKELEILKKKYPEAGTAIAPLLNKRNARQIQAKAYELGIPLNRKTTWTEEQIDFLKENYSKFGSRCEIPGKTSMQIWKKANQLKLKSGVQFTSGYKLAKWTEHELNILKEKYPEMGMRVTHLLPDKSDIQIKSKLKFMKLHIDKDKFKQKKFFADIDKCTGHYYAEIGSVRKMGKDGFYRGFSVFECQYCGKVIENPKSLYEYDSFNMSV